jgi:uncharacterized protein (DUF58 family)
VTATGDAAAVAALVLVTAGAVLGETALVAAAAVPAVYLAAGTLAAPPEPSLAVERSLDPGAAAPGTAATVTLTVRNEGERTLPDVRVVDGVPADLRVAEGSPCACLSLQPGETASFEYAVVVGRGDREFDDPEVRVRSLVAGPPTSDRPSATGDRTLHGRTAGPPPASRSPSRRRVGARPADSPGEGPEFYSVREYRPADDAGRINWRRFAKTGDLSTIDYRESHATEAVVVVDARRPARRGRPTGAELAAHATDRVIARLVAAGSRAGLAALGVRAADVDATLPSDRAGRPWIPVGDDAETRALREAVLDAVGDADGGGPAGDGGVQRRSDPVRAAALRERLPPSVDVVVATPALDDEPVALVEELTAAGHPVGVVSPDPTGGSNRSESTPGARVAGVERRLRLRRLREHGATVVDWDPGDPLSVPTEGSS